MVTDFEGVDVFIPGSSYGAKADRAGNWSLTGVPEGRFTLVAQKPGLGRAATYDVQVSAGGVTKVSSLGLSLNMPTITGLSVPNGAKGTEFIVYGTNFGASAGTTLQLTLNGALLTAVRRVSDNELRFVVPTKSLSGPVVVLVGGLLSNDWPFVVVDDRLSLGREWATVMPGRPRQLQAHVWDTEGLRVDRPRVEWAVTGDKATIEAG